MSNSACPMVSFHPTEHAALLALSPGADQNHIATAVNHLSFYQLLQLFMQFYGQYGANIWAIISDVIAMVQKPGGPTLTDLQNLAVKYGPTIYAMVKAIAAMLGISLPFAVPIS